MAAMLTRRLFLAAPALLPRGAGADTLDTWHDAARGRALPVRLRLPAVRPAPVVFLSHGLGGSRDGLAYLGAALAAAGFLAIHLQHPGTDAAVMADAVDGRAALAAAVLDVRQALARLQDGVFALDELARRAARGGPLAGLADPGRIAFAGHSYGAWTVQHLVGQRLPGGARGLDLPDPRIGAGIALSPSPPRGLPPRLAFARVTTPLLHVTGTLDHGFVEGATPEDRLIPYQSIAGAPQALLLLAGATHASFAGEAAAGGRWNEPTYHARVGAVAVLFLRAVLRREPAAAAALAGGARGVLAAADRLETNRLQPLRLQPVGGRGAGGRRAGRAGGRRPAGDEGAVAYSVAAPSSESSAASCASRLSSSACCSARTSSPRACFSASSGLRATLTTTGRCTSGCSSTRTVVSPSVLIGCSSSTWARSMVSPAALQASAMSRALTEP
jgi:predicted dienelactone hydrolase